MGREITNKQIGNTYVYMRYDKKKGMMIISGTNNKTINSDEIIN